MAGAAAFTVAAPFRRALLRAARFDKPQPTERIIPMVMPSLSDAMPFADHAEGPRPFLIGRDVMILVWDVAAPAETMPRLSCEGVRLAPTASLRLQMEAGGTRLLWVFRRPAEAALRLTLSACDRSAPLDLTLGTDAAIDPAQAENLVDGLTPPARIALMQAMLSLWASLFRLQRSRMFLSLLQALVPQVVPAGRQAVAVARASADLLAVQMQLAEEIGPATVHVIGRSGIARLSARIHRQAGSGLRAAHLLLERSALSEPGSLLVITGAGGPIARRFAPHPAGLPNLVRWFRDQAAGAHDLREKLLADLAERSEAGRAICIEVQLGAPLQPRRLAGGLMQASAEIFQAFSTPAGTLVTGWYRDPAQIVAGIEASTADGHSVDLAPTLHRFPLEFDAGADAPRVRATGFAALAPAAATQLLQPRFRLRLKSGTFHALVPPPRPVDAGEARAAALRAVPPQHVDERLLDRVLAPVIASLHEEAIARVGPPTVIAIGEGVAAPRVSIIIPLYKVLDFLRFQLAAFAADRWLRSEAELIYVLDSPEQAGDVEHLLRGLHLVHALPITLVVMERNGGYARANNEGAAVARAPVLALVNSDVIPLAPGWLRTLTGRLNRRRRIGAVGPKLLFEDGSIQHAGMYFAPDGKGRWLNHHFHKGMPRHYPPANEERIVPAVTGACLVTTRALFEKVGGFTESYVIGDYEDSDLCLKIDAENARIAYVPGVELYHLERRSISHSADYMRGIAWQYNCALHARRWRERLAAFARGERRPRTIADAVVDAGLVSTMPDHAESSLEARWRAA